MTCFIALSAFVKSSILDLDLVAYLPEMFLLIAMGIYALLRRISSGIDIRDMLEKIAGWVALGQVCSLLCLWQLWMWLESEKQRVYTQSQVSGQNFIRNSRLCPPDRSAWKTTCYYQSEKTREDWGRVRGWRIRRKREITIAEQTNHRWTRRRLS